MTTENTKEQAQQERDPVLDLTVQLEMKVEDVNALMALLAELPFAKSAQAISVIRDDTMRQVREQLEAQEKAKETPPEVVPVE